MTSSIQDSVIPVLRPWEKKEDQGWVPSLRDRPVTRWLLYLGVSGKEIGWHVTLSVRFFWTPIKKGVVVYETGFQIDRESLCTVLEVWSRSRLSSPKTGPPTFRPLEPFSLGDLGWTQSWLDFETGSFDKKVSSSLNLPDQTSH